VTLSKPASSSLSRETAADIEAAASAWAAKADRGPFSEAEQVALEAWAAADPRRAGAYARALAAGAYLDRASALGPDFRPGRPLTRRNVDRRRMLFAGGAIAASLAGAFGLHALGGEAPIITPKGDVRRVSLPEGSAVTLNTDTAIRPHLDPDLRRVDLMKGEALFDVAKDPARPFVVVAQDIRVRALGTSFTVRIRDDRSVEVAVREGVVEVSRADGSAGVRLAAQTAAVAPVAGVIAKTSASADALERAIAWREGRLDLSGLTLAQAAEEFARYSDRRILIDDPQVGAMRVAGAYSLSDPEGFARAAALSLGLAADVTPQGVRLRKSEAS
jgi:transmembrane sensor